jgi:putative intracellular protease/amidase
VLVSCPQASVRGTREMLKLGAIFSKKANWEVHVVSDGLLITGQNPHSSGPVAKTLMAAVKQKAGPGATARASWIEYPSSEC